MHGRRVEKRYVPASPLPASVRVLRDVRRECGRASEIVVISRAPGVVGHIVLIDRGAGEGGECRAVVVESRPVMAEGGLRHRLVLCPEDREQASTGATGEPAIRQDPQAPGPGHRV